MSLVSPGRAEASSGGQARQNFLSASQATPQRPEAGSSVAPVMGNYRGSLRPRPRNEHRTPGTKLIMLEPLLGGRFTER